MNTYQIFDLENGCYIALEVDDKVNPTEYQPEIRSIVPIAQNALEKVSTKFEDAITNANSAAEILIRRLKKLSDLPDEIEISFGLKAVGDVGNLMIAKASAEANYSVTLKWKRESEIRKKRITKKTRK